MGAIHSTAILEGDVSLGAGSTVGPGCYLRGPIIIGANTTIHPHCVIGTEPEHHSKRGAGAVHIGDGVILREFAAVHRGTGDAETRIGNRCFVMSHSYIAHDCVIEDDVTLSPNATLAGHTHVLRGATVGMAAATHQFSTIGAWAMVGMSAVVTRDVPPFALVVGNPARFRRFNTHRFAALGLEPTDVRVENGAVTGEHPAVREAIERFLARARRSVLPLDQR